MRHLLALLPALAACAPEAGVMEPVAHADPRLIEPIAGSERFLEPFFVYDREPDFVTVTLPDGSTSVVANDRPIYVYDAEPVWAPTAPPVAVLPRGAPDYAYGGAILAVPPGPVPAPRLAEADWYVPDMAPDVAFVPAAGADIGWVVPDEPGRTTIVITR